jgi:hypothetical protein
MKDTTKVKIEGWLWIKQLKNLYMKINLYNLLYANINLVDAAIDWKTHWSVVFLTCDAINASSGSATNRPSMDVIHEFTHES